MENMVKKCDEQFAEWLNVSSILFESSLDLLKSILNKVDETIVLDEEHAVWVSYDNEYESNPHSLVEMVYMKGTKIYIDTEDVNEYDVYNLSANELYLIAKATYDFVIKNYDFDE